MREYGQIQSSFWTHPDISCLDMEEKLIGAYLLTCQHTNGIGCFRMPAGYVSIDLNIPTERVSKGFQKLFGKGFLIHDSTSDYVLIPSFLRWNPISNPNSAKARVKEFDCIPQSISMYPALLKALSQFGKYWSEDFLNRIETLSKGFEKGSDRVPADVPDNKTRPNPTLTIPNPTKKDVELKPDPVLDVFQYWQEKLNHPQAKLDDNRRRIITNALKEYSVDQCKTAIYGMSVTPHNIGQNDRNQRFDGLHIVFKNAENFERFTSNAANPKIKPLDKHSGFSDRDYSQDQTDLETLSWANS